MDRDARLQSILTYHLIYFFISKALGKERPYMFPKSGAPMETEAHSRAFLITSFGVPSRGTLPPNPPTHPMESPRREIPRLWRREELRLRVFRKGVLKKMFGPKREEVTGGRMKLHNERLRDL